MNLTDVQFALMLERIRKRTDPTRAYGMDPGSLEQWFRTVVVSMLAEFPVPFIARNACFGLARHLVKLWRTRWDGELASSVALAVERFERLGLDPELARKVALAIEERVSRA